MTAARVKAKLAAQAAGDGGNLRFDSEPGRVYDLPARLILAPQPERAACPVLAFLRGAFLWWPSEAQGRPQRAIADAMGGGKGLSVSHEGVAGDLRRGVRHRVSRFRRCR